MKILNHIQEEGYHLLPPPPMRQQSLNKRAKHLFSRYHRDHGHNIEDCLYLKEEREKLIKRVQLTHFIVKSSSIGGQGKMEWASTGALQRTRTSLRIIHVTLWGLATEGVSKSTRKLHTRSSHLVDVPQKKQKRGDPITYRATDLMIVQPPYFDAIVIAANIESAKVRILLVDSGSSYDTLFLKALLRMRIDLEKIKPCTGGCGVHGLRNPNNRHDHLTIEYKGVAQDINWDDWFFLLLMPHMLTIKSLEGHPKLP